MVIVSDWRLKRMEMDAVLDMRRDEMRRAWYAVIIFKQLFK